MSYSPLPTSIANLYNVKNDNFQLIVEIFICTFNILKMDLDLDEQWFEQAYNEPTTRL